MSSVSVCSRRSYHHGRSPKDPRCSVAAIIVELVLQVLPWAQVMLQNKVEEVKQQLWWIKPNRTSASGGLCQVANSEDRLESLDGPVGVRLHK